MPALALIAGLLLTHQAPPSTPNAAVQSFVQAISRRDLATAAKYLRGSSVPDFMADDIKKQSGWPIFTLTGLTDTAAGARTIVDFQITTAMNGMSKTDSGYLVLTQVNGSWMIDAPKNEMLNQIMSVLTNSDMYAQAHKAAESTVCLSNVKQLCLGTIMCSNDNNDVLKFTSTNWAKQIEPYMKSKEVFHCPDDKSGTISYSFNSALLGINEAKIGAPATTVMIYEGSGKQLNFRHSGRAAVGFADGHAKLISVEASKTLTWKP